MPDRPRYYLTTAIAYPNNKPGLHTLYEVIGADVDRALASDEGRRHALPDRHRRALGQHRRARDGAGPGHRGVRRRDGRAVHRRRGRAAHRARPVHPDDRPGPPPGVAGDGPPRVRERRRLPRQVRGLVLPERGLQGAVRPARDARRHALPEPPERRAPVAHRAQLVLPPVGLPRPAARALRGASRTGSSPSTARTRCWRFIRGGPRGHLDQPRDLPLGHPVPDRARTARPPSARTARGTPRRASSTSGSTR